MEDLQSKTLTIETQKLENRNVKNSMIDMELRRSDWETYSSKACIFLEHAPINS